MHLTWIWSSAPCIVSQAHQEWSFHEDLGVDTEQLSVAPKSKQIHMHIYQNEYILYQIIPFLMDIWII